MKLHYVFVNEYQNPEYIQLHMHNCFEIVHYTSRGYSTWKNSVSTSPGLLVFTEKELGAYRTIDFDENTVIILPPNILHDEKHLTPSKTTAVGFSIDGGDEICKQIKTDSPLALHSKDPEIAKFIRQIEKEYARHAPLFEKAIELTLQRLIMRLLTDAKTTNAEEIVEYAKAYIDEHFTGEINLERLAQQIHYSEDHFRVLFKKKVGKTPKAYIMEKRLDFAEKLLSETDIPLTKISELCGFGDYVQFSKFFKHNKNISPGEYRRN